ncbi:MAG TPA: hypothetical protein VK324_09900, partial [Tepidisphaeraceae bacterium]|nr:hypothetical protein [Tepidisphaeraceae bacterium]
MSAPPAIPAPANATTAPRDDARPADAATTEPAVVKWTLIALAAVIMVAFIVLPLVVVFAEALGEGWAAYRDAIEKPETWDSIVLTL